MKQRVLLVGADGHDLLNRISTLDVSRLSLNRPTLGLILNPQGKIRASFVITRKGANESELEFHPPLVEILDQYTFAEKYELSPLPPSASSDTAGEASRIASLVPAFDREFRHDEMTNPLEVNLRSQIHDGKGCYPGQEVIEKIISLGSPPRKLVRLEFETEPPQDLQLPLPLLDPDSLQEVGTLTSVAGKNALGILRRTHLREGARVALPQKSALVVKKVSE